MLQSRIFAILPLLLLSAAAEAAIHRHRRLLHQPLLTIDQALPPAANAISESPFSSPSPQQPKYPFSTFPPPALITPDKPFFPTFTSPQPPPSPTTPFTTFPANISSLVLPSSSHPSHKPTKLISLIVAVSLFSVLVFTSVLLLLLRHRHHLYHHDDQSLKSDSLRLFPPNTTPSDTTVSTAAAAVDASKKAPPQLFPCHAPPSTSSEFLYLGTLVSSRDPENYAVPNTGQNDAKAPPPSAAAPMTYQSLGSPELQPLPPLPRPHSGQVYLNTPHGEGDEQNDHEEDGEELFFSPRASTANNTSPFRSRSSPPHNNSSSNNSGNGFHNIGNLNSFVGNSPVYSISPDNSPSVVLSSDSPRSMLTKSPDSSVIFPAPLPRFIPPPPARQPRTFSVYSPSTDDCATRDCSPRASDFSSVGKMTPPPPPPPPPPAARSWAVEPPIGPPELVAPSRKIVLQNLSGEKGGWLGNSESRSEETMKPKLKPLHWDKVRASSDRAMVWDQLKSSSFQLNEEMIETLFTANTSTMNAKDGVKRHVIAETNQENIVLDPKKSQNIAILLRALNVTVDEVCEALLEGNADTLGSELLESLLKMAPTIEEERKLMDFIDESLFKLGTAEAFLKAVLNIPFAFKRVDALLYVANFDSEIEHLKRSFDTLESACKELKSSRMFLKLLEAVLKTGNRMNTGTHRGDAQAFKLDTLLTLADVKGTDGKTTLLHFVVQEIIRAEGAHSSGPTLQIEKSQQSTLQEEVEIKKLGLQAVSRLSSELSCVKKAAGMDSDGLVKDAEKLAAGICKVREALKMSGGIGKFSENMSEFLRRAETEIGNVRALEGVAFSMVKGLTEYFHGDSGREEARPLRLFVVVRDFLGVLDRVCRDVGRMNERAMVNSGWKVQVAGNVGLNGPVFPGFSEERQGGSLDDEGSCSF